MRPKIKVCGLSDLNNIQEVIELKPDYIGFIFWEKSKRQMKLSEIDHLDQEINRVGVFVDAVEAHILEKSKVFQLDYLQLHGKESSDFCKSLKEKNHKIIKAFSIDESFDFKTLKVYEHYVDYFLFDTKGKFPGGNGFTFDWQILKNYTLDKPYFLSGGIGLSQVENLLLFLKNDAAKQCKVIDINSQFELAAGIKNINLLKQFFDEIHSR